VYWTVKLLSAGFLRSFQAPKCRNGKVELEAVGCIC
jgi:hypothetical protein